MFQALNIADLDLIAFVLTVTALMTTPRVAVAEETAGASAGVADERVDDAGKDVDAGRKREWRPTRTQWIQQ